MAELEHPKSITIRNQDAYERADKGRGECAPHDSGGRSNEHKPTISSSAANRITKAK